MPPPTFVKPAEMPPPQAPAVAKKEESQTMKMFAPMSKIISINHKDYMVIGDLGSGGSCKVRGSTNCLISR